MRYFQFPQTGIGTSACYITNNGIAQTYQLRGGNGTGGPYNWSNMPLVPAVAPLPAQCQQIGTLLADAGATVNMDYAPDGSMAFFYNISRALTNIFHYPNAKRSWSSSDIPSSLLLPMINPNLDAHYPVILGIQGAVGGHAVITDGYGYIGTTLYHHLNLGWSGISTVWYALPLVDTALATFTNVSDCIYNIYTNGAGEIISGRVTDQLSRPVDMALISATRSDGFATTTITDAKGIYTLPNLLGNRNYTVSASRAGFASATNSVRLRSTINNSTYSGNYWGADFTLSVVPDAVDHFTWAPIGSNYLAGQPIGVTITAQNATNNLISGFTNTVFLLAFARGQATTNTILGNLTPDEFFGNSSETTMGYTFTPTTNLQVLAFRTLCGDKVSIWTEDSLLVASEQVAGIPGAWAEVALSSNITLLGAATYRIGAHVPAGATGYYFDNGWPAMFPNGALGQSLLQVESDGFPVNTFTSGHGVPVDLRYAVVFSNSVPITPADTGNFSAGVWSGNIAVFQTATNLMLAADDGSGHTGTVGPITVRNPPGTAPSITLEPVNTTVNSGDTAVFSLVASGSPEPAYYWFRDGSLSDGAHSSALSLTNAQFADSGSWFFCIVSNLLGSRTSHVATLTVTCTNVLVSSQPNLTLVGGGSVATLARLDDGTLFLGGSFTNINGVTRYRLAKLFSNGSLDFGWNPSADGVVRALAVSGTNLFVGGDFSNIGGGRRSCLARLTISGAGNTDPSWNPEVLSEAGNPSITALYICDSNLFVAGHFTTIGDVACMSLARVSTEGSATVDPDWASDATSGGTSAHVEALAVSGTNLYVGGDFDFIGGLMRNGLARLSFTGRGVADSNWDPNISGKVQALALSGTTLYVGGEFTLVNGGLARSHLARFNTCCDTADPDWDPAPGSAVTCLAAYGTRVFVGGTFTNVGNLARYGLAKLHSDGAGAADPTWDANLNAPAQALLLAPTNLIVSGSFTEFGEQTRSGVGSISFAPFQLAWLNQQAGQNQIILRSEPGLGIEIQASSNMSIWESLQRLTNHAGLTNLSEPPSGAPMWFYRGRQIQ